MHTSHKATRPAGFSPLSHVDKQIQLVLSCPRLAVRFQGHHHSVLPPEGTAQPPFSRKSPGQKAVGGHNNIEHSSIFLCSSAGGQKTRKIRGSSWWAHTTASLCCHSSTSISTSFVPVGCVAIITPTASDSSSLICAVLSYVETWYEQYCLGRAGYKPDKHCFWELAACSLESISQIHPLYSTAQFTARWQHLDHNTLSKTSTFITFVERAEPYRLEPPSSSGRNCYRAQFTKHDTAPLAQLTQTACQLKAC